MAEEQVDEKKYFQKVLDDIVSLNSLFTVAVFIGLSFAQPGQVQSLAEDPICHPGANVRKRLVLYEIISFSCFIFAGFLGKAVKVFLYTFENDKQKRKEDQGKQQNRKEDRGTQQNIKEDRGTQQNRKEDRGTPQNRKEDQGTQQNRKEDQEKPHRHWMSLAGFYLSIYGTMLGCLLLLLAMIDVIQIKLGRFSCHSKYTVATVCVMVSFIGLSLLIFFSAVSNGVWIAVKNKDNPDGTGPSVAQNV